MEDVSLTEQRLQAALIHHRLPARAANRQQLRDFCGRLQIPLGEIVDQPVLAFDSITLRGRLWVLGRQGLKITADAWFQWISGRASGGQCLRLWMVEICRSGLDLLAATSERWRSAYRICLVESVLVQKHMAAWETALQAHAQWLLVFEDDAQIKPHTEARLQGFLSAELCHVDPAQLIHADLAGGYVPHRLMSRKAVWDARSKCWSLPYIQTNTLCTYLASHQLLACLLSTVQRYSLLTQLPVDHLVNIAALLSRQRGKTYTSFHWQDPFFRHGSFHVDVASSVSGVR